MKAPEGNRKRWRSALSLLCTLAILIGLVPPASAAGSDSLSGHVVENTVTPSGIVLNLFDYWVTPNRTDSDKSTPLAENEQEKYWNTGINQDHQLKFCSTGTGDSTIGTSINQWTGKGGGVYSNIVKDQLLGGFPVLASGNLYSAENYALGSGLPWNLKTSEESLGYLFDKTEQTGKKAFWNVQGLLQIDDDGYYYYNADSNRVWQDGSSGHSGYQSANYAAFDEANNRFDLYDSWGVKAAGDTSGGSPQGQFFPFTAASNVFTADALGALQSDISSTDEKINHYFGLTMTTRFVQRYGGLTSEDEDSARHVTYEFAGDDDVWLYIDGILVSDLGGIHNLATTSIDFCTGKITVNGNDAGTLRRAMQKYYPDDSAWDGETFADNTYHTMKLFYLERGGTDSNLSMKFNLAHVPETDGIKIDQFGNRLPGVGYTLYAADRVTDEDGNSIYKIDFEKGDGGALAHGITNENGKFVLQDGTEASISLNELRQQGVKYMILYEDSPRDGYRPPNEIIFRLATYGNDLLMLNDEDHMWHTGSYAQPKETIYANPNIQLRHPGGDVFKTVDVSDPSVGGTLFAVVMRRLDGVGEYAPSHENESSLSDRWGVVTGSALKGWNISAVSTRGYVDTILEAVKGNPENYYVFKPSTNGSYMTEVNNLPGDIREYYFWLQDSEPENLKNTAYTVAYYYTEADSVEKATAENTSWVVSMDFERQFTATIYIPNVENYLHVQKVDTQGNPVAGAEFSLYRKSDVTIDDGSDPDWGEIDSLNLGFGVGGEDAGGLTYTINPGGEPYDTVTTNAEGTASFPSNGHVLGIGEYYLVESSAPRGYRVNPTPVHIVVDADGVQADAGTPTDGISVSLYEGTLVPTMAQFAIADDIDRTLTDITATQLVGEYVEGRGLLLREPDTPVTSQLTIDVDYFKESGRLRYHPQDATEHDRYWITDSGWIWFRMTQDYEGLSTYANDSAYKRDLGDTDLTPLFSGETTVIVQDQGIGSLTVGKTVDTAPDSDTPAPAGQEFQFAITLENEDGLIGNGTILKLIGGSTIDGVEAPQDLIVASLSDEWTTTVKLKHGQTYTISDLPVGTKWHVAELRTGLVESEWTTKVNGAPSHAVSGEIEAPEAQAAASFVNTYGKHIVYAPVSVPLSFKVSKTYAEGSDSYAGNVKFTIVPGEGSPTPDNPENAEVTISGEGSAVLGGNITFESAGEYTYTIREVNEGVQGMRYDPTEYTVTIKIVEDKESASLRVESISCASSASDDFTYDPESGLPFENNYQKPDIIPTELTLSGALVVSKKYSGADKYDGTMTFTVTAHGDAPEPEKQSVTISREGKADFGSITFTQPGTYRYTVREKTDGNVEGMRYDSTVYTVTVHVSQNSDTSPLYAVTGYQTEDGASYDYGSLGSMVFTNRYTKPEETTGTLRIAKTVGGKGADQDGTFRFRVKVAAISGTYGSASFEQGEAVVAVKAGSSVSIPGLPAGASYSVTELAVDGYTVTSQNASGRIQAGETITASFHNEKTNDDSGNTGGRDDGDNTPALNRKEHYAYIIGYEDGTVRPGGNITRAEVATIFFRLLRDPVRAEYWSQTNPYPDVPQTAWFNNAISTLTNMGIISGYEDGTFHPNAPITRAELTKIATGFFSDERVTSHYDGRFSDVSGSEWFISALEKAIEEGVIEGYEDGTFHPNAPITRAESCTIINRTLGRKPYAERLLPISVMVTWPDNDSSAWYYAQMQEATNSHDYFWTAQSSKSAEKWTAKLADRDWAALERVWSHAGAAAGGEAMN